jgi:hypothetical protein
MVSNPPQLCPLKMSTHVLLLNYGLLVVFEGGVYIYIYNLKKKSLKKIRLARDSQKNNFQAQKKIKWFGKPAKTQYVPRQLRVNLFWLKEKYLYMVHQKRVFVCCIKNIFFGGGGEPTFLHHPSIFFLVKSTWVYTQLGAVKSHGSQGSRVTGSSQIKFPRV